MNFESENTTRKELLFAVPEVRLCLVPHFVVGGVTQGMTRGVHAHNNLSYKTQNKCWVVDAIFD